MSIRQFLVQVACVAVLFAAACGDATSPTFLDPGVADADSDHGSEGSSSRVPDVGPDATVDRSSNEVDAPLRIDLALDDTSPDLATLRIVHASPDTSVVDAHLDGDSRAFVNRLAFGDASERMAIEPGNHVLSVQLADRLRDETPIIASEEMTVPEGSSITAIVTGGDSASGDAAPLQLLLLSEDFQKPPADRAAIRVVHAGGDTPPLQLDLQTDGVPEFIAVEQYGSTCTEGVLVRAGKATRAAVWTADGDPEVVTTFTLPPLQDGDTVLLVLTGRLDRLPREPNGLALLAIDDLGALELLRQDPLVYTMHAAPNAPRFDLFLDEIELADELEFGELSAPIQLSPGPVVFDLYDSDLDLSTTDPPSELDQPIARCDVAELVAGERYLAVATGVLGQSAADYPFHLMVLRDGFDIDDPLARLRIVNATPQSAPLGVGVFDDSGDLDLTQGSIEYGAATAEAGIPLPFGALLFKLTLSETLLAQVELTAEPGERLIFIAAGAPGDVTSVAGDESFGLFVVDVTNDWWVVEDLSGD